MAGMLKFCRMDLQGRVRQIKRGREQESKTSIQFLSFPFLQHHSGIDDTKNIARILARLIVDGCIVSNTSNA
jgi:hypothetical protein